MSRTKKVTRARRHIAALQSKLAAEQRTVKEAVAVIVRMDMDLKQRGRELEYMRENLAPHLAKLATVTVGVPWQRYEDPPPSWSIRPLDRDGLPQMLRIIQTPTQRNIQVNVSFSREMIEFIADGHEENVVREMALRIFGVASAALLQIVPEARRRGRERVSA